MRSKIEVFVSPSCPHCPGAVKAARDLEKERNDVKVVITNIATKEGRRRAERFGIFATPTTLVYGPGYPEKIGIRGIPSKEKLEKAVSISLGKEEFPQHQGLWERIKRIFG